PVTLAQENADPRTVRAGPDVGRLPGEGLLVLVVVLQRDLALVEADMEVVVEVAAVAGIPRHGPAHPLAEPLDAGDRRAGHPRQRGIAGLQVGQVADAVDQERAGRAARIFAREPGLLVPPHEV